MARQPLRVTRGTAAQVAAYIGPAGEPVFNSDTKRLHVQDGGTAGGSAVASLVDLATKAAVLVVDQGNNVDVATAAINGFYLGLGTAYVPAPSGDALSDTSRFNVQADRGLRYVEHQDGTYKVSPAGLLMRSGQELIGHGSKKTIWKADVPNAAGTPGLLAIMEKGDVALKGLAFDYAGLREPFFGWSVLSMRNVTKLRMVDVDLLGFSRFALSLNGGADFRYEQGQIIRAVAPIDASGNPIAKGAQNQAIVISDSASPTSKGYIGNIYCKGSGVDASGSGIIWENVEVDGFDFGFAFVTEQGANSRFHQFLRCKAHGGYTNPATGLDVNATSAGGWEIWSPGTIIDKCEGWDLGGDGISLGGKGSTVTNNKLRLLGMQVPSNGITARYEVSGAFSADGSLLSNNTVIDTTITNDGSHLLLPYYEQDLTAAMVVSLYGNNFGTIPFTRKGVGAKWGSPGLPVVATSGAYTHTPGSIRSPTSAGITGARRTLDTIVGVTFKGTDGSALPTGLRAFAEVNTDNAIAFYTQDISGGSSNIAVPAGTFTARLISIN